MNKEPLVDNERIIAEAEALAAHFEQEPRAWNYMARMIERELKIVRDEYEAALDGARKDGFDAAVADGDVLDEWKERCWRWEQENTKLRKRLAEAEYINANNEDCLRRQSEPTPGFFNAENFDTMYGIARDHERRILELERVQREGQGEL